MARHGHSSSRPARTGKPREDSARAPRFFVTGALGPGARVVLDRARAHQLAHVLRLRPGSPVRLFNAECGEWLGTLGRLDRSTAEVEIATLLRPPGEEPGPRLALAPIRPNRLDWIVEKAVELGAAAIDIVPTRRGVVRLERSERLGLIAIEAAEQCGRLSVPPIVLHRDLAGWLATLGPDTPLVLADETGGEPVCSVLRELPGAALLVGPEGGFAPEERTLLLARPGTRRTSLGPRILRSETAAMFLLVCERVARAEAPSGPP